MNEWCDHAAEAVMSGVGGGAGRGGPRTRVLTTLSSAVSSQQQPGTRGTAQPPAHSGDEATAAAYCEVVATLWRSPA